MAEANTLVIDNNKDIGPMENNYAAAINAEDHYMYTQNGQLQRVDKHDL